jgi:RecA/RadA recombinase
MAKVKEEKDRIDLLLESKEFKGVPGVYGVKDIEKIKFPEIVSTNSIGLDIFLDGGFRCGWSKWQGDFESGKTSMALCWGKNWQQKFPTGQVIYIDAEGKLDKNRLLNSGINYEDKSKWRAIEMNNADKIFDFICDLTLNNSEEKRYFFVIDSINSMRRTVDMDKTFEEAEKVGAAGLLLSAAGSRLSLPIAKFGHHLFIISQIRANVNTRMPGANPVSSGPNAPKFYCSLMGEIQKLWTELYLFEEPSDTKSKRIGHLQTIKFTKTFNEKTGQIIQVPIRYGLPGGIWHAYEAFILASMFGFIQKSSAWFNLSDAFSEELQENGIEFPKKIQGEKQLRIELDSRPEFVEYTVNKIKKVLI